MLLIIKHKKDTQILNGTIFSDSNFEGFKPPVIVIIVSSNVAENNKI